METLFSGALACLHVFRHICIAGSALILHLPRTFSYNDNIFLVEPTTYVIVLLIAIVVAPAIATSVLAGVADPLLI